MKFIRIKRFLSFLIDFLIILGVIFSYGYFFDIKFNDFISILPILLFVLSYYFIPSLIFEGKTIGNYIMKLKVCKYNGEKISLKLSLLRFFLLIFDTLSLYVFNLLISKRNNYQSFTEIYSYTVIVPDNFKKFEIFKPIKKENYFLGLSIFIISILFFNFFIFYQIKNDFNTSMNEIHSEFNEMVSNNLKELKFSNDNNQYKDVQNCMWYDSDVLIFGTPEFVYKLYFSKGQERKFYLKNLNSYFSACIEDSYTYEEMLDTQQK